MKRVALACALLVACGTPAAAPAASPAASLAPRVPTASAAAGSIGPPIQLLDARTGWVAVGGGLEATADGGRTWRRLAAPQDARFIELRMVDARRGWAVLDHPGEPRRTTVATTDDGWATSRERLSVPAGRVRVPTIGSLNVLDERTAFVSAADAPCDSERCPASVRATADGGTTWTRAGDGLWPLLARFAGVKRGWVLATADEVRVTADGGRTWGRSFAPLGKAVTGIEAASEANAWIAVLEPAGCTSSGCAVEEVHATTDGGVTWRSLGDPRRDSGCPAGFLHGPVFATAALGWIGIGFGAGTSSAPGGVLRTADGGRTWVCHAVAEPRGAWNVEAVGAVADAATVWALLRDRASGAGALHASTDGGLTWSKVR